MDFLYFKGVAVGLTIAGVTSGLGFLIKTKRAEKYANLQVMAVFDLVLAVIFFLISIAGSA